jgi:cell division protein FtsB
VIPKSAYNGAALWRGEKGCGSLHPLAFITLRRLIIGFTLVAVSYFIFAGVTGAFRNQQLDGRKEALEQEIAQLEQDRAQLEAVREYLTSDEYIERAARSQLGLVRPGELGVVIVAPTPDDEAGDVARPWWKRFFE